MGGLGVSEGQKAELGEPGMVQGKNWERRDGRSRGSMSWKGWLPERNCWTLEEGTCIYYPKQDLLPQAGSLYTKLKALGIIVDFGLKPMKNRKLMR